jgi:hypothetical protein
MSRAEADAEVISVSQAGDTTLTRLLVPSPPAPPLAPSGLYAGANATVEVWQLHKLVEATGAGLLGFETYGLSPPPGIGERLVFRPWWDPRQLAIAADRSLEWRQERFASGDHEHCLLTWATIWPGDKAYRSTAGWLSTGAYERFIRDDRLRLREKER